MKAETIIILTVLIVLGFATGIFLSANSSNKPIIEKTPIIENTTNKSSNFTKLVSIGQNLCEGCHLSGKKFIPQAYQVKQHVEGGAYCLKCHTINHDEHPINDVVTCSRCHGGSSPQIPQFKNGTIPCAECHNHPDPLIPSEGNLIVIHRPRGIDCIKCHLDSSESCLKCHDEIKNNDKWNKRLTHFRTLSQNI